MHTHTTRVHMQMPRNMITVLLSPPIKDFFFFLSDSLTTFIYQIENGENLLPWKNVRALGKGARNEKKCTSSLSQNSGDFLFVCFKNMKSPG